MLNFYDVDPNYTKYLQQYDCKIPNIIYTGKNKFVCGVVLVISGYNYFVPISSHTKKQQTNLLIKDEKNSQF